MIYIGGANCEPCKIWKGTQKRDWVKSKEYPLVRYVEIEPMELQEAYVARNWREWRWVLDGIQQRAGTPRFIVLKNRDIISNSTSWTSTYGTIKLALGG
ncbi:MAG: hypothetical protein AB7G10_05915 [Reyranellaceae bacterium]